MENVPKYYKIYTDYKNIGMLPSVMDGCIPVHRRMLLTLHLVGQSYIKTAKLLGELMARFHPHSSAETVAETLVSNGLADGDGGWGCKIGIEPIGAASPRYTKIRANKEVEKFAFKYIDSVEFEESELDPEPKYIPSMFPICLLGSGHDCNGNIGSGYKSEIPCYERKDLYRRLLYLIGETKTEPVIEPKYYNCDILSSKKDLKEILTTGNGTVKLSGKITEDKKNLRVYLHGWTPKFGFQPILNKINSYMSLGLLDNSIIGYIDESTDDIGTKIRFEVLKQRNTEQIYENMLLAIKNAIESEITYSIYAIDKDSRVKIASVDEMLLNAYKNFSSAFETNCNNKISECNNKINEYDVIYKIRPYISDSVKNNTNEDDMIEYMSKKSKVDKESVKGVVDKYKIKKLLTLDLDKTNLQNNIKDWKTKLGNIQKYVLEEYEEIK